RDGSADLAATAARALGRREDREAAPGLARLLEVRDPGVRLAAAEALARTGDADALPAVWKALAANPDRFLEHALTHAAHCLAGADTLEKALRDGRPRIQQAALLLLDQPPRPKGRLRAEAVLRRVGAGDAGLRQTALRVLAGHPEWAAQARDLLRGWLARPRLSPEETTGLRSLVLAFQGQPAVQELVAAALAQRGGTTAAARRVLLLETLAQSSLPRLPESWVGAVGRELRAREPEVRTQAVRTAVVLQIT